MGATKMASSDAQTSRQVVLSESLIGAIAGRRVTAAVFTTFEFEPDFFELHVLPCLFSDSAWSHMPNVKRFQVGEALQRLDHVAVFYDHRGLKPSAGAARLDYDRIALARPRGVFHSKNILLLVEDPPTDKSEAGPTSLVLMTASANLTRNGWHENVEVAHVLEIASGEAIAVRRDMLGKRGLLSVLKEASPYGEPPRAITAVRDFLRGKTENAPYLKHHRRLRPRLYVGREPLSQFLCEAGRIEPNTFYMEIISPFFENTTDARTLKALVDAVSPIETRVYLPRGDDGKSRCAFEYFEAVRKMQNVHWALLPAELTQWSGKSAKVKRRNVHAKVYRLFKGGKSRKDWREIQLVGSVNLTAAAHAGSSMRNFESAILVDLACKHKPDWWMKRLGSIHPELIQPDSEDDPGTLACHELTLRYDWKEHVLDYFWKSESQQLQPARIVANGCPLFEFKDIVFTKWCRLREESQQAIREHLKSSSLVDLVVADEQPQPLLVQEVNMAYKPSLFEALTAAEILEYWSLLTPERRNAYLENKLKAIWERTEAEATSSPLPAPESLFDRFAGIFHAFSCLEEHVLKALKRGAEKEATYRLFGENYDSLPALAKKVKDAADKDPGRDPVTAYVTLLCAVEVFRRLRRLLKDNDFFKRHKDLCDRYKTEWRKDCQDVKGRISWEGEPEPTQFFEWYEKVFAGSVKLARDPNAQDTAP